MLYLSSVDAITKLLFIDQSIEKVDIAIVFGNDWIQTMDDLYPFYKEGMVPKIIITGNSANGNKEPESLRFQKRGIEIGFSAEDIILESRATNTKENFIFSKEILEKMFGLENINKILLVCKTFHTRRVLMTAKNFLPDKIEYFFLPTLDERNITKNGWWKEDVSKQRVLEEVGRISQYTLKGDLKL